jgi:hypothetical protein
VFAFDGGAHGFQYPFLQRWMVEMAG